MHGTIVNQSHLEKNLSAQKAALRIPSKRTKWIKWFDSKLRKKGGALHLHRPAQKKKKKQKKNSEKSSAVCLPLQLPAFAKDSRLIRQY
jgi:hypothetical protein